MELPRTVQLFGLVLMGVGVAVRFARPERRLAWQLTWVGGGVFFLGGTLLSSEWRDSQPLQSPYVWAGLVLGAGIPFLFALLWHRHSRKPQD